MQVLDLYTGRVLRIFDLSPRHEEEDYTYFRYFSSIRKFVLGTARGDISLHKADTGQMEALFKSSHNTLISHVEYD